jgi:hypothetical protein
VGAHFECEWVKAGAAVCTQRGCNYALSSTDRDPTGKSLATSLFIQLSSRLRQRNEESARAGDGIERVVDEEVERSTITFSIFQEESIE